ncbi:MAG: ABC transporter permease [Alphaproteobacteria bacterium]|nr:ABC transporter permease [Alphaproteobacteria bacterium]
MLDALAAERLKLTRHKATWFLVWLYPVLFLVAYLIAIAVAAAHGGGPSKPPGAADWISQTAIIWKLPDQTIGRLLIGAYVAVAIAGEYGWNTWKLVIPHRSRTSLLLAKVALIVLLFLAAFLLTAGISLLFTWIEGAVRGRAVPTGVTASAILDAHGRAALAGLAPFLFTLASVGLAAILTRSTIAALVIGVVVAIVEKLFVQLGPYLSPYAPSLVWGLYHALPGYHLVNLASWVTEGAPHRTPFPDGSIVALDWTTSLAVAGAWTAALGAAAFAAFRRQDIN